MDHISSLAIGDDFRPMYHQENLFDSSQHNFHTFPEEVGWEFKDDRELSPIVKGTATDINHFLQSWLFFGLLETVIQLPQNRNLILGDFLSEDRGSIDTKRLSGYLEEWRNHEVDMKDDHTIRMIRTQVALDRAREVVRDHCSMDGQHYRKQQIHPELCLSLMVLGETLSNAKSKIVEKLGCNIRGWYGDATEGWGSPECLLEKMKNTGGWCPGTLRVLRGQLKSMATSLLAASYSHDAEILKQRSHINCNDAHPCQHTPVDGHGKYQRRHTPQCPNAKECRSIGPLIEDILTTIEGDNYPLLSYDGELGTVTVHSCEPHQHYATISHVWADGYGNPDKNELWQCQLNFFQNLFRELPGGKHRGKLYFWIDTLAVPVGRSKRERELRDRAIKKIHDIYNKARYTIVVDDALTQMGQGTTYEGAAMRILASGWMRRLWTLQEAYVSRRLMFAFKYNQLKNLDDLEDTYNKASDVLTSSIATAARDYFHNMLGQHRNARMSELSSSSGSGLLASVWRASQWRTTSHKGSEALALATLLNVDYQDSISKAGRIPEDTSAALTVGRMQKSSTYQQVGKVETPSSLKQKKKQVPDVELDKMMRDLWKIINETCPGSIPPGIIFLPGPRISFEGFRWAPRTWMSGKEIDYPDPLSNMTHAATLTDKGLQVTYPGFLLHSKPGRSILGTGEEDFHFTTDSSLFEWYSVDWKVERITNSPVGVDRGNKKLAVILCRPRPRGVPEIALLVEIVKTIHQRSMIDQRESSIYHVHIVCRVKITRETKQQLLSEWRERITQSIKDSVSNEDIMIFGEVLDETQKWYVDGRPVSTSIPQDLKPSSDVPPEETTIGAPAGPSQARKTGFNQKGKTRHTPVAPSTAGPSNPPSRVNTFGSQSSAGPSRNRVGKLSRAPTVASVAGNGAMSNSRIQQ